MGWKTQIFLVLVAVLAGYVLRVLIRFGHFTVVHNHLPGNCTRFTMPGSEDMVLYPNHHVLISSGIHFYDIMDINKKFPAGIYLMDLNLKDPRPVKLPLEGFPTDDIKNNLAPHGMAGWVKEDGSLLLYFVNHRKEGDVVDSFEYQPSRSALVYRKTFRDPLFHNLNNLVMVGVDKFYVTVDRYFESHFMKTLETLSIIPWPVAPVLYVGGGGGAIDASGGLRYPNGIEKSRDGKYIFVNELGEARVLAFTRNSDNTLQKVQEFPIQPCNDNIFVDPQTGDLWIAILVNGLSTFEYFHDQSVPVRSKILHIRMDPSASLPFDNAAIEEVFSSNADDGVVGAVTVGVYAQDRLLVGTIAKDMMMCDVHYLKYK